MTVIKTLPLLIIILLYAAIGNAVTMDEVYPHLKTGKDALEQKDYKSAVNELTYFLQNTDILQDYALLWRCEAYNELDKKNEALNDALTIVSRYQDSPVYNKAVALKTNIDAALHPDMARSIFEDYLKDYPDSDEMRMKYGYILLNSGDRESARRQFLKLYIKGVQIPDSGIKVVEEVPLTTDQQIEIADRNIKSYHYKEVETSLRRLLKRSSAKYRKRIYNRLGTVLFRQKSYMDAADYYSRAYNLYDEAYSLYRADYEDNKVRINEIIRHFKKKDRAKADELLFKKALSIRRNGDIDEALKVLKSIPDSSHIIEDVSWEIGWTYFRKNDIQSANEVFNRLKAAYPDLRYAYWSARTTELMGRDATPLYAGIIVPNNYYSLLAQHRLSRMPPPISIPELKINPLSPESKRLSVLLSLNMRKTLNVEGKYIMNRLSKINKQLAYDAVVVLNKSGHYNQSISIMDRMTYEPQYHELFYPLAFVEFVDPAAAQFSISPNLIFAVMREESRFNESAYSCAGAIGLMQLMPATARKMCRVTNIDLNSDDDIFTTKKNIYLGASYLSMLLREFNSIAAIFASYNAGEIRVKKWLSDGNYQSVDEFVEDIPFTETKKYTMRCLRSYFQYLREHQTAFDDSENIFRMK